MGDRNQPRKLRDLLEPGFSEGYEGFKELVDFTSDGGLPLTPDEKAWTRLFELSSVAAIEGLNQVESEYEIEPHEAVMVLWSVIGAMLATVNGQAFQAKGKQVVRREMIKAIRESHDRAMKGFTESASEEPIQ